jgi:hypothetical protein
MIEQYEGLIRNVLSMANEVRLLDDQFELTYVGGGINGKYHLSYYIHINDNVYKYIFVSTASFRENKAREHCIKEFMQHLIFNGLFTADSNVNAKIRKIKDIPLLNDLIENNAKSGSN